MASRTARGDGQSLREMFAHFDIASDLFKSHKVELLRPEGKLIAFLVHNGPLTMKQAMSVSECSYRGFYLMVDRLEADNLVSIKQSADDRRVKFIHLNTAAIGAPATENVA